MKYNLTQISLRNALQIPALLIILNLGSSIAYGQEEPKVYTGVTFRTSDNVLQKIFDEAEKKAKLNIKVFSGYEVLIEGAGYNGVWLETQPMGGFMYAKRNTKIALNNIRIFLDNQRTDGRFPGMITCDNDKLEARYGWFQGYCFPMPAFELYYWLKKDQVYLERLYAALEKFDNYLWRTRDSDHNGCLETWCVWDTGEDSCSRYNYYPNAWAFDYPPSKDLLLKMSTRELLDNCNEVKYDPNTRIVVPMESMDIMSYSYSGREVLSLISGELKNGKDQYWIKKADSVKTKLKEYLWDDVKHACFDKDKDNVTLNNLVHNNLRCMYYGSFDQQMADAFIKYHILNPDEFWTPMPLPSIAIDDPLFRNVAGNNWSGQPQGLTYQRSIAALENYGHFGELTLLGKKFLKVIGDSLKFTQQFDPFSATINNSSDGYGPSILTSLEFISRLYGLNMSKDKIYWTCINSPCDFEYNQLWDDKSFRLSAHGDEVNCYINEKQICSFTKGARVVTDMAGKLIEVTGVEVVSKQINVSSGNNNYRITVYPNEIYRVKKANKLELFSKIDYYQPPEK